MTYETLAVKHDGPIDWLTLDRPECLNAISHAMIEELHHYFSSLMNDHGVRIVVMRGQGRAFCSGMDLRDGPAEPPPHDKAMEPAPTLPNVVRLMRQCPQPIIASVHGPAYGGGFSFALAADLRLAGETARMNVAFINLGLSGCELGVSYFLPRLAGLGIATELMYTGDFIDARRALASGLVSRVVPDSELENLAQEMANSMLRASPQGLRMTKQTLNKTLRMSDLDAIIDLEEHTQMLCINNPEFSQSLADPAAFIRRSKQN